MRREALPAPPRRATAASRRLTAERCSSTSSVPSRCRLRIGCSAPSNMARSPASAPQSRSRSTCASSQRPMRIFRCRSTRASSVPTCSIACRSRSSPCRRCVRAQGDVPLLAEHFGRRMAVELEWPNWPGFTPRALAEPRGISVAGQRARASKRRRASRLSARGSRAADRRDQLRSVSFALGTSTRQAHRRCATPARMADQLTKTPVSVHRSPRCSRIDHRFPRRRCRIMSASCLRMRLAATDSTSARRRLHSALATTSCGMR